MRSNVQVQNSWEDAQLSTVSNHEKMGANFFVLKGPKRER